MHDRCTSRQHNSSIFDRDLKFVVNCTIHSYTICVQVEWEKSERKAKEYEKERRQSVRRAREQASKDLGLDPPPLPER